MMRNECTKPSNIRLIEPKDNAEIARVIRKVLMDVGAPKKGTAYEDDTLEKLFETYDKPRCAFFVVEENEDILGCAGISPLAGEKKEICELQKMYFSESLRGRGIGAEMIKTCLNFARENEFSGCYLETLPYMKAAQKLYKKSGFKKIDSRMGITGHYSCNVWMFLDFENLVFMNSK